VARASKRKPSRGTGGPSRHRAHSHEAGHSVGAVVIVVSTTRTAKTDESGKAIADAFESSGHRVVGSSIVKDDVKQIAAAVREALNTKGVDIIVTSGGTGMGRHDVTVEALLPLIEKRADGWGDVFRAASRDEIGNAAFLSRSLAGVTDGKWIVAIPGSVGAARTAMSKLILPELEHMIWEARR